MKRERWDSRIGLILAMAGNAIGLGNFLRFPRQAALNGGGAFMIPYFVALLLMGIPLMWLEWAMGRYGGKHGESTTAGQFHLMWKSSWAKYAGSIGISIPLLFAIYYTYIESWCLGYSFFSLTGSLFSVPDMASMNDFLLQYQGVEAGSFFSGVSFALAFWVVSLAINVWIMAKGISGGIEKLAKVAMPLLLVFAVVLVARVFMVGTPDPSQPGNSVMNGLAFIWNPDFSRLSDFSIWLAAAGQIFFTLSIGNGTIQTYASYLREDDDCALTGLTTSATNEFVEVVLGGSIAIPIAVAFFGLASTTAIAQQGSFDLGFVAMPVIFGKLPLGFLFSAMWFLLLFFAGITSSVALCSPFVALLVEKFGMKRKAAAMVLGAVQFVFGLPVVLFLKFGYLDQYDFWIGMLLLSLLALVETLVFAYAFGMDKGWEELNRGALLKIPGLYRHVMKYVVPAFITVLFAGWLYQDLTSPASVILLRGTDGREAMFSWIARGTMVLVMAAVMLMTRVAWSRK